MKIYKNNIHGILLLDKPSGISSNQVLQKIKKFFNIKKVGYSGTLDPLATGILPICCGNGTKFSDYLMNSKKSYYTVIKLGQITSTYDADGVILEKRVVKFSKKKLFASLKKLTGSIVQYVPMYSAVKYKGIPLYKYARSNSAFFKIKKSVYVYKICCIKYSLKYIELKITCSKGTYIRTLAYDLGKYLSCGAHVVILRRIKLSCYNIKHTVSLDTLLNVNILNSNFQFYKYIYQFIIPIKLIFLQLPEIKSNVIDIFSKKKKICFVPKCKKGIVRITLLQDINKFIIGNIGSSGELLACKLLNFI